MMRGSKLVFLAVLFWVGCRDEQAGPRPRADAPGPTVLATAPEDLTFRSVATWSNGALRYFGSRVFASASDGSTRVSSYFGAQKPVPEGYRFFLHVVDAQTGQWLANADHPLPLPNGQWPLGKVIEDTVSLRVPPGRAVELRLGFFQADTRLPVDLAQTHDGEMRVHGPVLGTPAPLPVYRAHRAVAAPKLDGHLDDEVWAKADSVVLLGSLDGRPVQRRTVAKLAYDDHFLYAAFDCEDDDIWGTYRQRDEPLYTEEVVEIFLDASGDGRTYHEVEVSPHNVLFDAYFPARRQGMDMSWDSDTKSAVWVRGTLDDASDKDIGWSVELKIPISRLKDWSPPTPLKGASWRMNLYRLEHLSRKNVEGQAFSPLFIGDFHNLPRFGWLTFD